LAGAGGFINISQSAKAVVFLGTFTTDGLTVQVTNGRLTITQEGKARKFVAAVEHRTFSGSYAMKRGCPVLYVTERCVFRLSQEGMELIEVAPGIDVARDILAHMDFVPIVRDPALMDARIFRPEAMGLRARMLTMPFDERISYDPTLKMLFLDFSQLAIISERDVQRIKTEAESHVKSLQRPVHAIVNYSGCSIESAALESYGRMVD
jgi:propionate CoA-transferase